MNNAFSGDVWLSLSQFIDKTRQNGIQININSAFGKMLSITGITVTALR
jgi:hypothetical protein